MARSPLGQARLSTNARLKGQEQNIKVRSPRSSSLALVLLSGVQPPIARILRGFNTLAAFLLIISSLPYFIKNIIINKNFGFTHQRKRGGTQQEFVVIVVVVDKQHMYIRRESAID